MEKGDSEHQHLQKNIKKLQNTISSSSKSVILDNYNKLKFFEKKCIPFNIFAVLCEKGYIVRRKKNFLTIHDGVEENLCSIKAFTSNKKNWFFVQPTQNVILCSHDDVNTLAPHLLPTKNVLTTDNDNNFLWEIFSGIEKSVLRYGTNFYTKEIFATLSVTRTSSHLHNIRTVDIEDHLKKIIKISDPLVLRQQMTLLHQFLFHPNIFFINKENYKSFPADIVFDIMLVDKT